jgi:hypothetical protein
MSMSPCFGKEAFSSRERSNRALLLDLTQPFIKKPNAYMSDPDITEEEENTYKQVIRKLKVYLVLCPSNR